MQTVHIESADMNSLTQRVSTKSSLIFTWWAPTTHSLACTSDLGFYVQPDIIRMFLTNIGTNKSS